MSVAASRPGLFNSVGLAAIVLSMWYSALAEEKTLSAKDREYPYELMICDYVGGKLYRVNKLGKSSRNTSRKGVFWDFVLTDDDKVVYPMRTTKLGVRCIDFKKNVIRSWPYCDSP